MIAWSIGTPFATLLRSFQEAGLDVPLMTTSGNLTYAQTKAYAGIMPGNSTSPQSPRSSPIKFAAAR